MDSPEAILVKEQGRCLIYSALSYGGPVKTEELLELWYANNLEPCMFTGALSIIRCYILKCMLMCKD
jgi:hypothetical protein